MMDGRTQEYYTIIIHCTVKGNTFFPTYGEAFNNLEKRNRSRRGLLSQLHLKLQHHLVATNRFRCKHGIGFKFRGNDCSEKGKEIEPTSTYQLLLVIPNFHYHKKKDCRIHIEERFHAGETILKSNLGMLDFERMVVQ